MIVVIWLARIVSAGALAFWLTLLLRDEQTNNYIWIGPVLLYVLMEVLIFSRRPHKK